MKDLIDKMNLINEGVDLEDDDAKISKAYSDVAHVSEKLSQDLFRNKDQDNIPLFFEKLAPHLRKFQAVSQPLLGSKEDVINELGEALDTAVFRISDIIVMLLESEMINGWKKVGRDLNISYLEDNVINIKDYIDMDDISWSSEELVRSYLQRILK